MKLKLKLFIALSLTINSIAFAQIYNSSERYFDSGIESGVFIATSEYQSLNLTLINRLFGKSYRSWDNFVTDKPNPGWINGEFLESYSGLQGCSASDPSHNGCQHKGIDYRASIGTQIFSPISGVIKKARGDSFGTIAIYNSQMNKTLLFLHMSETTLNVGDVVSIGQLIGKSGEKGVEGAPHVHLELRSGERISGQTLTATPSTNYDPRIIIESVNNGSQIYAGNPQNPQNIQLLLRIPEWSDNEIFTINSISNIRISDGVSIENIATNALSKFSALQNGYYIFDIDLPSGRNWASSKLYSIDLDLAHGTSIMQVFGYNQIKFTNGNFTDNNFAQKWVAPYAKNAALYGLLGGSMGTFFGNENDLISFGTAARLVVNAAIKLRVLSNNNAGMFGAFSQSLSGVTIDDPYYNYFQILKNWNYSLPSGKTTSTIITTGELSAMLEKAFGIIPSTPNGALIVNDVTPDYLCNQNDILLKQKHVLKIKNGEKYAEPILSCFHPPALWVYKGVLTKILANTFEFKHQSNFGQSPSTNARISQTNTTPTFQILGIKKEFQSAPAGSQIPAASVTSTTMNSGETKSFVYGDALFGDVTIGGQPVSCYWSVDGGTLDVLGGAPYFQSVRWTAPTVSSTTTFHLYQYASTAGGFAREYVKEIVVNPVGSGGTEDVFLTEVAVDKAILAPNETLTAEAFQNYSGNRPDIEVPDVKLKYYLSSDCIYDANDDLLLTDNSSIGSNDTQDFESAILTIPANTTGGNYYIMFKADADNELNESNENNNVECVSITVSGNGGGTQDVFLSDATVDPVGLNPGEFTFLEVSHKYSGSSLVSQLPDIDVEFLLSSDCSIGGDDISLAVRNSSIGVDDDYDIESAFVEIPMGITPGNYFILFKADKNNEVTESDENNNLVCIPFEIFGTNQDIFLQDVLVWPNSINRGGYVHLYANHSYIGDQTIADLPNVDIEYYLSSDCSYSSNDVFLDDDYSSIGIDDIAEPENANVRIPTNTSLGNHFILFRADVNNEVYEINESNNLACVAINVKSTANTTDIVVKNARVNKTTLEAGEAIRLDANHIYSGTNPNSPNVSLGYYLSTDCTFSVSEDIFLDSDGSSLNSTAPGDPEFENTAIPVNTPPGNYFILFVADRNNDVAESNENNNVACIPITVTGLEEIDLTNAFVNVSATQPGQEITVSATQTYFGSKNSWDIPYVHLGYYLSSDCVFSSDDILLDNDVSTIGVNSPTENENQDIILPLDIPLGNYYILFVADSNNDVEESDENDNTACIPITINTNGYIEDISVTEASTSKSYASPGDVFRIDCKHNYSGIYADWQLPTYDIDYYLSSDCTLDENDLFLTGGSSSLGSDDPSHDEGSNIVIPLGTSYGQYYILFVGDSEHELTEANETNNIACIPLLIGAVLTPPTISVNVSQICEGQSIILTASNCTGTITWNNNLGTGNTKSIQPTMTTTYSAYCSANGVNSGNSNEVTVIVNPIPDAPVANNVSRCGEGSVNLGVSGCNGTVKWYESSNSGLPLSTDATFSTPTISATRSYYASCEAFGCEGARTPVIATVNPIPSTPSVTGASRCGAGSVTLSAVGCSGTYNWYDSNTSETVLHTGSNFTTPSLSTTQSYYVECQQGDCQSSRSMATGIINIIPPTPSLSATRTTINTGESTTLNAGNCSGTVTWSNGLGTGNSKTISPATSTTYTANCTVNGCVSTNGNISITVNQGCIKPDLTITDVSIVKYGTDRVHYRATIKNIGNVAASMGAYSLGNYGSANSVFGSDDTFKSTLFLGGGSLQPNATMYYDFWSSMNWRSNQHYVIFRSDELGLVDECDESNNVFSKLVKKCTSSSNLNISGNLASGLYASNQIVTINGNTVFSSNTIVVGRTINGLSNLRASSNNVSFVVGTCLFSNTASVNSEENDKTKTVFEFVESAKQNEIKYSLIKPLTVSASVWNSTSKEKVADLFTNQAKLAGLNTYNIDSTKWVAGNSYVIHFETNEGTFAKLIEWE